MSCDSDSSHTPQADCVEEDFEGEGGGENSGGMQRKSLWGG